MLILPGSTPHWAQWDDARLRLLFVQKQAVAALLGEQSALARRRLRPQVRVRDRLILELIDALRIHHEHGTGKPDPVYAQTLSASLLVQLFTHHAVPTEDPPRTHRIAPRALAQLFEFIDANLAGEITVQMLADVAHLSCFHFIRAFKDETSYTPLRFVMLRRIQRAQRLLSDPLQTIAEIAYQVGFRSPTHFSHAFRAAVGTTPRAFREQLL